jgi:ABC-type microcin C transport system permease subunit YejB
LWFHRQYNDIRVSYGGLVIVGNADPEFSFQIIAIILLWFTYGDFVLPETLRYHASNKTRSHVTAAYKNN